MNLKENLIMNMTYVSNNGRQIIFDDYVDNTVEYNSYWVGMCQHCYGKYKHILGNREDDCGSGFCSVKGCNNEADYYVDFDMNEVEFMDIVVDAFTENLLHEQYGYLMDKEHGRDTELLIDIMKCNGIDLEDLRMEQQEQM